MTTRRPGEPVSEGEGGFSRYSGGLRVAAPRIPRTHGAVRFARVGQGAVVKALTSRSCPGCGSYFAPPSKAGRPPTYCAACRERRRADDAAWRAVRATVLTEEPFCAVVGCRRAPTTVDHIVALSRGGARLDRANLQAMCGHHNFSKGARPHLGARAAPLPAPLLAGRCTGEPCPDWCTGTPNLWHL